MGSSRRRQWRALFVLALALVAWLGCNSLLGISDPAFVPLPDSGLDEAGNPIIEPTTSPILTSRLIIRVPRGDRSSFTINVDPAGKPGNVVLTAKPLITQDVSVFQATDATVANRFKITLTATATAANVDEKLSLQAVTDKGAVIGSADVRVLVGTPGAIDVSFGDDAGTSATIGAPQQVPFALAGVGTLFVAEDNSIMELGEDGFDIHQVFSLDTKGKPECGIASITADQGTIFVAGFCPQSSEDFLAQGAVTLDAGVAPIDIVPQQDLFKIARFADAGFYLALAPDSGTEIHSWPPGAAPTDIFPNPSLFVPITVATSLIPGDGGLMVVGREEDPDHISEIARISGKPFALPSNYGDAGVVAVTIADPPTSETVVGAASTTGLVLMATPLAAKVLIQGYSYKGEATNASTIDGFSQVAVTADRQDRFIVLASGPDGKVTLRRFKGDSTADPSFTANVSTINTCSHGQVGVDDDNMIVVFCANSPVTTVFRVWP